MIASATNWPLNQVGTPNVVNAFVRTGAHPDFELRLPILPQKALPYRLCGDRNPLQSDPNFFAAAWFPRQILHRICTYGIACKAIVDSVLVPSGGVQQLVPASEIHVSHLPWHQATPMPP